MYAIRVVLGGIEKERMENTKGKSIGDIYIEVCQIRRFYDVIAELLAKSRDELVEDDLNSVSVMPTFNRMA